MHRRSLKFQKAIAISYWSKAGWLSDAVQRHAGCGTRVEEGAKSGSQTTLIIKNRVMKPASRAKSAELGTPK